MTPSDVEALLERYYELDAHTRPADRPGRRRGRRGRFEPLAFRAAVQRADIDRALAALCQHDRTLWETVRLVHLLPDGQPWRDEYWQRLRSSLSTRRQLAALDLTCSSSTVYRRCREAYRFLAPLLSADPPPPDTPPSRS